MLHNYVTHINPKYTYVVVNQFEFEHSEWATIRVIYELSTERRYFNTVLRNRAPFVILTNGYQGGKSDEIIPEVLEMLLTEVQMAIRIRDKYWTDKYSFYTETHDLAADPEVEAKRLKAKACTTDEVIEALRVKQDEAESRVRLLTTENEKIKKEVHLCKVELNGVEEPVVNNYRAYFHKIDEYDDLDLYWRKVAYNEVFGRIVELYPQVDLTSVKEKIFPTEPSTLVDDVESSEG
ncbi:Hypothetical predicted protein [Olea europaea subsp. europaea]|uniref:Uncharacterized protein n=1 Tax=Olea europaea subsp. europaea TaxID=158383 RepID=A0A8S0QCF4_OLEEU|nr:Hypothetical predicted protein [Olea europaea subsp. europaea]